MLVLAHRGLPGAGRPENTLAALAAAFASGADGVEVDLRLSADGVLVASHDPGLERVSGCRLEVASTPWPTLDRAAAGSGVRLARVEQVLLLAEGRRVVLEVKAPPPAAAAQQRTATELVDRLGALQRAGVPLDVTVSSFSPLLLRRVRRLVGRGVRTALLGSALYPAPALLRAALAHGHDEMHPHLRPLLARPATISAAHGRGVAVVPWTVNGTRDLRRLHLAGADAVITDVPAAARAVLGPAVAAYPCRPGGGWVAQDSLTSGVAQPREPLPHPASQPG